MRFGGGSGRENGQLLRGFELQARVDQWVRDGLEGSEGPAELFAGAGMVDSGVEDPPPGTYRIAGQRQMEQVAGGRDAFEGMLPLDRDPGPRLVAQCLHRFGGSDQPHHPGPGTGPLDVDIGDLRPGHQRRSADRHQLGSRDEPADAIRGEGVRGEEGGRHRTRRHRMPEFDCRSEDLTGTALFRGCCHGEDSELGQAGPELFGKGGTGCALDIVGALDTAVPAHRLGECLLVSGERGRAVHDTSPPHRAATSARRCRRSPPSSVRNACSRSV